MKHVADIAEVLAELGLDDSVTDQQRMVVGQALRKAEHAVRRHLLYEPCLMEHTEFHPQQYYQALNTNGIWEVSETRAWVRQVSEAATNEIQLQHLPVRGDPLIQLWVDYDGRSGTRTGAFAAAMKKTVGTDYWPNYDRLDGEGVGVCSDGVIRALGLWPTIPGSVKVVYTAGYSSAELRGNADGTVEGAGIWETVLDEAVRRARRVLTAMKHRAIGIPAGVLQSESLGDYSYTINQRSVDQLVGGDLSSESLDKLQPYVNYGIRLGS